MMSNTLRHRHAGRIALLVLVIAAPFVVRDMYIMHILVLTFILAIFALSYDLIIGHMGQFSLGHQAFFGLGAYITAVLAKKLGIEPWLGLPACVIVSGVLGLVIGAISLRTRGAFLAIVTLGFALILWMVATGWREVTHGETGIGGIPPLTISLPLLPKVVFDSPVSFYYLALALLLFTIYFLSRLLRSRFGMALKALRENEERGASLGINAFRHYLVAFTLAAILASLAGFAYAEYLLHVSPIVLSISYMITGLIMVVVGGSGTLGGPILGAVVFVFVPELLRIAEELRFVFFGIVLIALIVLMPQGIYPGLPSLWNRYIVQKAWIRRATKALKE